MTTIYSGYNVEDTTGYTGTMWSQMTEHRIGYLRHENNQTNREIFPRNGNRVL